LADDVSGSMQATDVAPNRLVAARRAAKQFVASVPKRVNVGVMAFNQTPRVLLSPTTDRVAISGALDQLAPSGGTATGLAIQTAMPIRHRAGLADPDGDADPHPRARRARQAAAGGDRPDLGRLLDERRRPRPGGAG